MEKEPAINLPKENYDFYKNRAHVTAEKIRGDFDGYRLLCQHDCKNSTIFFRSKSYWDNRTKKIGMLCYNEKDDIITYLKRGFVDGNHTFNKSDSIGLCWNILDNLTPHDFILIEEHTPTTIRKYSMSARKAFTFAVQANFKYFKSQGYEKQVMIPKEEFDVTEQKTKRRKRA